MKANDDVIDTSPGLKLCHKHIIIGLTNKFDIKKDY